MYLECRHVPPSGQKCKYRALKGRLFCYHHGNLRQLFEAPRPLPGTLFVFPNVEDNHGLLLATMQTLRAFSFGQLKRNEAALYLSGITIASRLVKSIQQTEIDPIRALEYDDNCYELGEQMTGCEPLHDCLECKRRDVCEVYEVAQTDKNAPIPYKKLIAKQQKMSDRETWDEWMSRGRAQRERRRQFRSLALDPEEEDNFDDLDDKDQTPTQPEPQSTQPARI